MFIYLFFLLTLAKEINIKALVSDPLGVYCNDPNSYTGVCVCVHI